MKRIDTVNTSTVQLQEKYIQNYQEKYQGIVLVGASCVGKTTLINYIKESEIYKNKIISVPKRFITRQQRVDDDLSENVPMSLEEFEASVVSKKIDIYWKRYFGDAGYVRYGFKKGKTFSIYSANNAILYAESKLQPLGFLRNYLVVCVVAPEELRIEKMKVRFPAMSTDSISSEEKVRMSDKTESVIDSVDVVISHNFSQRNAITQDFMELVDQVRM